MHELEGAAHGLRVIYRLIDLETLGLGPDALPELLLAAERMGFAGVNVTYPCKQEVVALVNALSPDAALSGAVNTVVFSAGKRIGHNTDCTGFAESYRQTLSSAPRERILLLGAGGAGSAVAVALLREGAGTIAVADPDETRAHGLVDILRKGFGAGRAVVSRDLERDAAQADGIVNCTPVGSVGRIGAPVDLRLLQPALWVADVVYFPMETQLLAAARHLGCRTLSGGGMAVFQAAAAFRLFTGREPDAARMFRRFEEIGDLALGAGGGAGRADLPA